MFDTPRPKPLLEAFGGLAHLLEWVSALIEIAAVLVLLIGVARFGWEFAMSELGGGAEVERRHRMNEGRIVLARYILAALEVFIVADLLVTVVTQTLESLVFLGVLVILRSVMSWFLEHEMKAIEKKEAG